MKSHQHQHVWNHDHVGLIADRHGRLEEICSVLSVGHRVVVVKRDVVFLDLFSGQRQKNNESTTDMAGSTTRGEFLLRVPVK